ncbi:MAG: class I SAM-dependent methyltransferase [Alphaproteobacteria bacterium]|nr:class I SAM-dependent methyltransferase [Alphaproteobacteria bacterium]
MSMLTKAIDALDNEGLISPKELKERSKQLSLDEIPKLFDKNRRPTVNNNGWQFLPFNTLTLEFLQQICDPINHGKRIYEVGAAMGNVAIEVLKRGAQNYILNDIEERHLLIFLEEMHQNNLANNLTHVRFSLGKFPHECYLTSESVHFGLINNVMQFLTPAEFEASISKLFEITAFGGAWYITTLNIESPFYESFKNVYEKRKSEGQEFPGYCTNVLEHISEATKTWARSHGVTIPNQMLFMSPDELAHYVKRAGFVIERLEEYKVPFGESSWEPGKDVIGMKVKKRIL